MGYRINAIVAASELFSSLSTPFDGDTKNFETTPTVLECWLILHDLFMYHVSTCLGRNNVLQDLACLLPTIKYGLH